MNETCKYTKRRYNIKKRMSLIIFCLLSFLTPITAFAQVGFSGQGVGNANILMGQPIMVGDSISVSEARNLPHDSWVVLTGNIINALPGGKYYTFRDASGEIPVEIGMKHWRGLSVGVSDRVEIYGEVKVQRGQYSIKVQAIDGIGRTVPGFGQSVMVNYPILISEARNLPHDSFVRLTGNIVNSLPGNNKYYTFRDSSGEVTVDIGNKQWRGISVSVYDRVELFGEVKINRGQLSIKVHAIRKI